MSRAPHAHAPDETDAASSLLDPPLPYRMHDRLERAARDLQLQQFVANATRSKLDGRIEACRAAFGDRYDELRLLAGRIKQHTLDHLDHYLDRFVERAAAAGTTEKPCATVCAGSTPSAVSRVATTRVSSCCSKPSR